MLPSEVEQAATTRTKIVNDINLTLANLEIAKERVAKAEKVVRDANAQLGTAKAEVHKIEETYRLQVTRLLRKLPDLGTGTLEVEDARTMVAAAKEPPPVSTQIPRVLLTAVEGAPVELIPAEETPTEPPPPAIEEPVAARPLPRVGGVTVFSDDGTPTELEPR